MKKDCVICGLSLPYKFMFYFGEMEIPENFNEHTIISTDCPHGANCCDPDCFWCDGTGKHDVIEWTGVVNKEEYWECPFHFGIFWALWHWLVVRPMRIVKGWIS